MVLLRGHAGARGAARFGAVIEDDHTETGLAAGVPVKTRVPLRHTVRPVPAKAQPVCGTTVILGARARTGLLVRACFP
jgi:hypothetical protein